MYKAMLEWACIITFLLLYRIYDKGWGIMKNENLKLKTFSSLAKIFADSEPAEITWIRGSMLLNEVHSFQVAYKWDGAMKTQIKVSINSELSPWISVRKVGLVPSEMPCYADHDDYILRSAPGLYPDPLYPLDEDGITLLPRQWRALWIAVEPAGQAKAGIYPIEVIFSEPNGDVLGNISYQLEIINACLPEQKLIHTEWFHTDCLATYYGLEVFSEEHWRIIERYVDTAVKHGINMILTPLFTPPLDTAVGGERPTVQLVDVQKSQNRYGFDFSKLRRWVDMCRSNGIKYFEFSHLFTQWGAKHAPKIMAVEDRNLKRIFGWDTDASGDEYKNFLSQFIPELRSFLKQNNLENVSYFHISDEPRMEHLEDYKKAGEIINGLLSDYPVIDALSDYIFYEKGLVKNPIPANNHIQDFIEHRVPDLWTYYCCSQYKDVSNRFLNMTSARNRILGIQLYKFNIKGFLHWGYNFWYSRLSRYPVDPFKNTDAYYGFPSGDAFVVYPGKEGPIESLRLEVLYEALQDMRALELLETFIGKEAVVKMLEEGLEQPITFKEYPRESSWLLMKREQINRMIQQFH